MIEVLAGQGHSPKKLCRMFGVAPSGFYYWRSKPPTIRAMLTPTEYDNLYTDKLAA